MSTPRAHPVPEFVLCRDFFMLARAQPESVPSQPSPAETRKRTLSLIFCTSFLERQYTLYTNHTMSLTYGGAKRKRHAKKSKAVVAAKPKRTVRRHKRTVGGARKKRVVRRHKRTTVGGARHKKRRAHKKVTHKKKRVHRKHKKAVGGAHKRRHHRKAATHHKKKHHKRAHRSKKGGEGPSLKELQKEAKRLGIPLSSHGKMKSKSSLSRAIGYRRH
jgi:hypothetical protein